MAKGLQFGKRVSRFSIVFSELDFNSGTPFLFSEVMHFYATLNV